MTLSNELDLLINKVLMKAENQHELLFGDCKSDLNLNSTQEHILMLLYENRLTSTELSRRLSISQAAVTKAIKNLVKLNLLTPVKDIHDARVTYFELTMHAIEIAKEHKAHHDSTLNHYQVILDNFSDGEQEIIRNFIKKLEEGLEI